MRDSFGTCAVMLMAISFGACVSEPIAVLAVRGSESQTLRMSVGQELTVTLQTVGPGAYQSPPDISSSAVRFLHAELVGPFVPAGPTQQFRFRAEARGEAVITFSHSGTNRTLNNTVIVR
jgi:hypothetical protein